MSKKKKKEAAGDERGRAKENHFLGKEASPPNSVCYTAIKMVEGPHCLLELFGVIHHNEHFSSFRWKAACQYRIL